MAEVDLDERIHSVMLVSDAQDMQADFCQALKSSVDNGIVKTAGRAAGMNDPHEIREFFGREWNRSMEIARALLNEKWADLHNQKGGDVGDIDDDTDTDDEES
jgi:hypothetical protein